MRGDVISPTDLRSELTGGAFIRTEADPDNPENNNYFLSFYACRFKEGYNAIILRGCNTVRFQHCVWNGFRGEQVILLNGVDQANRADPVEFVQCAIAAGTKNPGVDNVVINGQGGSIKFIACAILFGRHGIWMRNTTAVGLPKFLYFTGGGFENGHGHALLLESGADAKVSNAYISTDNDTDGVKITSGFLGAAMFADTIIRGNGRHGMDIDSAAITVTGCVIGSNGFSARQAMSKNITGVASSGGNVVVTTATAHGWETGDFVTIKAVGGATSVNARWQIVVVDATHIQLVGATLNAAYTSGGYVYRHGAGINLRPGAKRVVISGNVIGNVPDGGAYQDIGIVNSSPDVLVSSNDLSSNLSAPYILQGTQGAEARFFDNKGLVKYDGYLTVKVSGAVSDGLYDFGDTLYLDGRRIRILRIIRKTTAGTCGVRIMVNGAAVGGADVSASTSTSLTNLSTPYIIDGIAAPQRLQLRVAGAAAAENLEVQFTYQILG